MSNSDPLSIIGKNDISEIWWNGDWIIGFHFREREEAELYKQQIIDNQIIVEKLKDSIKSIEVLADKDTMYDANSKRLKLVLPYLQSILEVTSPNSKSVVGKI